ncbi:MAG: lamin tail domain-containing protein [Verrucomicrobiota bacterium]
MRIPLLFPTLTLLLLAGPLSLRADVVINELLASNRTGLVSADESRYDWIELHNQGVEAVDLTGHYLTDKDTFSLEDPETLWPIPETTLDAGAFLVIYASGLETPVAGESHASFKLSSRGERLALIAPDGETVVSEINFPEQRTDVAYGLFDDQWQYMDRPTPGETNIEGDAGLVDEVQFSVERGIHDEPFLLTLSTATEGAEIEYTLTDREPAKGNIFTGRIGAIYTEPIEISTTTVVRARATKPGFASSTLRTSTYIFLEDVIRQPKQPEGFPERWGSRTPDYEVDPEVVDDTYGPEAVINALRVVPTVSLVTENDNLFASDGIYTNSQAKDQNNGGINDLWERPVSLELFGFPHGESLQVNAGIRMQGNASRSPNRVKHNMRVVFRSDYGPGKLRFRLFEDAEADTFNSINLRSNNGDSWIHPGVRLRATYIRDQWHREVQRLMHQPHQTQIYAHVYINGLYWGMYHVFERFEASLLAEHFGGDEEDWDALQDTPAFQDIVVNGSDDDFRHTHDLAKEDLSDPENYDKILDYVDVDNQIDYLLLNWYSGNQDWDHKNSRYGRRRGMERGELGAGWMYFAWDSERAGLNGLSDQSLTSTPNVFHNVKVLFLKVHIFFL